MHRSSQALLLALPLLALSLASGCGDDPPGDPSRAGASVTDAGSAGAAGSPAQAGAGTTVTGGSAGSATAGTGGAPACTPEDDGYGGSPAFEPAPPPDGRECVVESFELCTPGHDALGPSFPYSPPTLSRCENGHWKTLESPSDCQAGPYPSCIRGVSSTTGKATIHDDVCCTTPGYCDNLKALCDGTRWHMDPGYSEPPL